MSRRRPPVDFEHCRDCGAPVRWPPKHTREHTGPQDTSRPVYLDLDGEPKTVAYEPRYGHAIHGAIVTDLSANEQREADQFRLGDPHYGMRRIVKCFLLHACDPRAVEARRPSPAPHGGQDRAAGEHMA